MSNCWGKTQRRKKENCKKIKFVRAAKKVLLESISKVADPYDAKRNKLKEKFRN